MMRLLRFTPPAGCSDSEARRLVLLQFSALFGMVSMVGYAGLHAVADASALAGPIGLTLACIPFYAGVLVLNRRGRAEAAKLLLCLVLGVSVFLATFFFLGRRPGMHFFFLLAATVPLLFWSLDRWRTIGVLLAANMAGFLVIHFRADESGLLVRSFPQAWVGFYEGMSFVAVYATILVLLAFFQRQADLDARALDLKARVMEELMHRYEELAKTDALTGLLNRRAILLCLEEEAARMNRNHTAFSVILLDIDRFKDINDSHGHEAGDLVLKELAADLTGSLREIDRVGRWGGEEFLILLPDTQPEGARVVAEKIRTRIEDHVFRFGEARLRCTVTLGIAAHLPDGASVDTTVRQADLALYEGKRAGRNRVV